MIGKPLGDLAVCQHFILAIVRDNLNRSVKLNTPVNTPVG